MLSIQLIGFSQKNQQLLQGLLQKSITEEFNIVFVDCFEDTLNSSLSNPDISVLDFTSCKLNLYKIEQNASLSNFILFVNEDDSGISEFLEKWEVFDFWELKNLNEFRIKISINNLLRDSKNRSQIEILQSELFRHQRQVKKSDRKDSQKDDQFDINEIEKVFNYSPCSVVIANIKGEIEYVNPQFSKIAGYTTEEVIGKNPRILKSGKHNQVFYEEMWGTLLRGEVWTGDICNQAKNGQQYWERVAMIPIKDHEDNISHFVVVRVDDMERRKAEDALRKADTLKTVRELAGGIAHEFSQPLQVLTINSALMDKSREQDQLLERNKKMIQKISALVDNLKNLTDIKKVDYLDDAILDLKASSGKNETQS